ncbi:MAG: hypothetical protein NW216_04680 [Hyphomicrobium sp.]|nr:hypothetical protein [Hyphomicrobium sp.]
MGPTPRASAIFTLLAAAVSAGLGACSMDDVAFNGGVFDAMGLNSTTKKSEPQMVQRGPLVVPPTLERLPQPGEQVEAQAADVTTLLDDPDRKASINQAEMERQQAEYCKKNYELAKAVGDNNADLAAGPLGPCRPSVLSAIKQINAPEPPQPGQVVGAGQ